MQNVNVTDAAKARGPLTLLAWVFFGEAAFLLFSQFFFSLASRFASDDFRYIFAGQQLFWAAATAISLVAVWQLSQAMEKSELLFVLMGLLGLSFCFELFWTYQSVTRELGGTPLPAAVSFIGAAAGIAARLAFCIVLGRLAKLTPYAAGLGILVGISALITLSTMIATDVASRPMWIYTVRTGLSLIVEISLGIIALKARDVPGAASAQPGAPVVAPEPGGLGMVLGGLALLVLGGGVTLASYASASGGGRYVIATGAIASGIVTLVRGIGRMSQGR